MANAPIVTELRLRGYSVLPAPRHVRLADEAVRLDGTWRILADGLADDDVAVETLQTGLRELGLALAADSGGKKGRPGAAARTGRGAPAIRLAVKPGSVKTGAAEEIDQQGYLLRIEPGAVEVTGNAAAGLFYAVQTLLQLAEGDGRERLVLPAGEIRDWPAYLLRIAHWDTKHHQDRLETLRRYLDWMARFKLNAVSFEWEDKFEYPSHPAIGAPGAFTLQQMRELTAYALRRHIQIIPNIQAPAHVTFVLKHPEFAHLKCDGSNYMACMDEPEVRKLIFEMYDDACKATPGVRYFHVSTDEVYYAGICEKHRQPYNPENRSLTWVDFVNAAYKFLRARGREVIIWAEFPLLPQHLKLLPPDIIDGIANAGHTPMVEEENRLGIRQFAYHPTQGEEWFFPNYYAYRDRRGQLQPGRLTLADQAVRHARGVHQKPFGAFCAAWDDSGLHNETFWLGWASMAQLGWSPGRTTTEQTVADFMDLYYGREVCDMVELYRDMQEQARFFEDIWDRRPSKVRGPAYGASTGKRPVMRSDLTLDPPPLPNREDLVSTPIFAARYAPLVAQLPERMRQNDRLLARLQEGISRARRNRYNLEVFLAQATYHRHVLRLLGALAAAEELLVQAGQAHAQRQSARAVALLEQARTKVEGMIDERRQELARLTEVWEKSRYPRNVDAEGKPFLHVMDDVKDHVADRRRDLSYMVAPEESIGLEAWRDQLEAIVDEYARRHGVGRRVFIPKEPE